MSEIYGFKVGSTTYEYDYEHLANKPEKIPEYDEYSDQGKALMVGDHGCLEWVEIPTLPSTEDASEGDALIYVGSCGEAFRWGSVLPPFHDSDDGKVLVVDSCAGGPAWRRIPSLPEPGSSDVGKVLVCWDTDGGLMWDSVFPVWGCGDEGKVLTIGGSGELEWR